MTPKATVIGSTLLAVLGIGCAIFIGDAVWLVLGIPLLFLLGIAL